MNLFQLLSLLSALSAGSVTSTHKFIVEGIRGADAAVSTKVPVPEPAVATGNVAAVLYRSVGTKDWCTDAAGREDTTYYFIEENLPKSPPSAARTRVVWRTRSVQMVCRLFTQTRAGAVLEAVPTLRGLTNGCLLLVPQMMHITLALSR